MRLFASILSACLLFFTATAVEIDHAVFKAASRCLGGASVTVKVNAANYCIVENTTGQGYAVITHRPDGSARVLGYSTTSAWDEELMPPAVLEWLEHIASVARLEEGSAIDTASRVSVEPLLTCHWHQRSPYNDLAPVIEDGNVKCVAGCVAIAAAQITYYWRKDNPEFTLEDTPIYPYGGAPVTMSIPAGTPNDWDLMRDEYTDNDSADSRAAAARLCYVIGTTSYLNYASSTSGQIYDAANAINYQYCLLSDYRPKSQFTQEQWDSLLYQEVIHRRPVMCSGQGSGGHAFVLDGYDKATGLFHFNFGWGGNGDGYYAIDDSEDAMGGYYRSQSVVCNIHPEHRNITAQVSCRYVGGGTSKAQIQITNNSTLPIEGLSLYAVIPPAQFSATQPPVWQGEDVIPNDGTPCEITINGLMLPDGNNILLYLTDENGEVLAMCDLESSGTDEVTFNAAVEGKTVVYDLNGHQVKDLQPDNIYIINNGMTTKKVIIK